jgi:hypothetical protein
METDKNMPFFGEKIKYKYAIYSKHNIQIRRKFYNMRLI